MSGSVLRLAIVGHVDHGKSTLIGRFLYEAGSLPEDIKRQLENSEFAYFTDHLEEERIEERTIDTAQAFFRFGNRQYAIIDTPGHKEFIKNMLTGASQADAAILIVSAFEGVEEQTKRHAYLLKLLGIKQTIIAINKMDKVNFDQKVFNKVKREIIDFFDSINVPIFNVIPISARCGDNLFYLSTNMKWYTGATISEALNEFLPTLDPIDAPFRMPVQGVYNLNGKQVVMGRIASGKIKSGERVIVVPRMLKDEIVSIEVFGAEKREGVAGESVGLILANSLTCRGQVISEVGILPKIGNQIHAHLFWMDREPLLLNEDLTIKCATEEVFCHVEKISERFDSSSLEVIEHNASQLNEAEAAKVIIGTEEPLAFENFSDVPELGRFVLEKNGRVCAGGIIGVR